MKVQFSSSNTAAKVTPTSKSSQVNVHQTVGASGDKHFAHVQTVPSAEWTIKHNLNKHPAVSVVDSAGNQVEGDVVYTDLNTVKLIFQAAFSGTAYFN